jgi:hypothetical protein
MEVLRVPPYPITTTWEVPEAEHDYLIYVEDVVDHSVETTTVTSDEASQITYSLPRSKVQYDRDFVFRIYDTDIFGEIVTDSNLTVYRPYVDPNTLGTTPSEVTEYKRWEIIARSLMDTYLGNDSALGEGFYNHKLIVQGVGLGTDYYPIWHNPKRVLQVYENNVLVYNGEDVEISVAAISVDGDYTEIDTTSAHYFVAGDTVAIREGTTYTNYVVDSITSENSFTVKTSGSDIGDPATVKRYWEVAYRPAADNSAIVRVETGLYNRSENKGPSLPTAVGDLGYYGYTRLGGYAFPKGYDYTFILDVGYKAVPADVEQAAMMLIDDLKCGRNEYYKRFVTQYNTDQFDIKFDAAMLGGTGNLIVDKILDGYKGNVIKPGII